MNPSTAAPSSAASAHPPAVQRVYDDRPFRADGDLLALAFAADGTLWTVEDPGVLRRWDLDRGRQVEWHLLSELENLWVFGRGARVLASASDEVSLWDVPTGQLQAVLPQPSWVTALALRGEAGLFATGHEDGAVCVWDAADDDQIHHLSGHRGPVSALAFSPDGTRLASAGEDRVIRVWDLATGRASAVLEGPNDRIPALAWHPSGQRLYSAGWDTSVWVWDVAASAPVILLNSHAGQVQALAVSPDGSRLASADSGQTVHLWDLTTHRPLRQLRDFEGEVRCLAFRDDGAVLASGGTDRVVHVWSTSAAGADEEHVRPGPHADALRARPAGTPVGVALAPDGARLASLSPGKGVRVWETATERKVMELAEPGRLNVVA
ncbi:MAG TPA: hypothetical protein VFW33_04035, partial [Gemmataceae bacterium]|nr:hypothetical protein [Gemmataceae bacterium]